MQVKNIFYAYPSSAYAVKFGFAKRGCHYVEIGDEDDSEQYTQIAVKDMETAIEEAAKHDLPWGNYSMYKGEQE